MNDSSSNKRNSDLDYSSESNQVDEEFLKSYNAQLHNGLVYDNISSKCVVDEQFVPKVGITFKTLEEARKFYKNYSKLTDFSTKIRNTTRKGDEIKNQSITCNREERWKSKIYLTLNKNWNNFPIKYGVGESREREIIRCCRFLYCDIVCNKITNRGSILACFRNVQVQFRKKVNHITRSTQFALSFRSYEIVEQVSNLTFNKFVITYDSISREFESRDILCRYSLSVLSFDRVDKVALKYIGILE
ncbi:hypothetical protein Ahy_A03g016041 isoform A [Arachis hypogaea]|uniref:Protein FAR1-RELATED SEQUENCE n=1 Tax=Arachis hypogaea TaxID=3818 RepID=A0A445E238_ARAHY|nr:hypothetical protein Ahy_A03g016041 isoform A [Arachis hypogaea]